MGMPVSVDIPNCSDEAIFQAVFAELEAIDEQFSPFKTDSELSRFRRGELAAENVSIGMKDVMKGCLEAETYTDGYFSARYGKQFDPTGYVKGWAIDQAARLIADAGYRTYCLSLGGDITAKSDGDKTWRIGIQNPTDRHSIIGRLAGKNFAVATSGNYERGDHVIDPKSGRPAKRLLSLTVAGPEVIRADVLATAAYAMGPPGIDFIIHQEAGYEAMGITKAGKTLVTPGMDKLLEV